MSSLIEYVKRSRPFVVVMFGAALLGIVWVGLAFIGDSVDDSNSSQTSTISGNISDSEDDLAQSITAIEERQGRIEQRQVLILDQQAEILDQQAEILSQESAIRDQQERFKATFEQVMKVLQAIRNNQ